MDTLKRYFRIFPCEGCYHFNARARPDVASYPFVCDTCVALVLEGYKLGEIRKESRAALAYGAFCGAAVIWFGGLAIFGLVEFAIAVLRGH